MLLRERRSLYDLQAYRPSKLRIETGADRWLLFLSTGRGLVFSLDHQHQDSLNLSGQNFHLSLLEQIASWIQCHASFHRLFYWSTRDSDWEERGFQWSRRYLLLPRPYFWPKARVVHTSLCHRQPSLLLRRYCIQTFCGWAWNGNKPDEWSLLVD